MQCPICCEELKGSIIPVELRGCAHVVCQGCLVEWFKTCEQNHLDAPTCPQCRQSIAVEETEVILGRAYVPPSTFRDILHEQDVLDELTREWLTEQEAKMCRNCGAWITLEDGCDAVQCLCGYRFCWGCGLGRDDCECGIDNDDFYDNLLGEHTEWQYENIIASAEEILNFRSFLESCRQRYNDWVGEGDTTPGDDEELVVMQSSPEGDTTMVDEEPVVYIMQPPPEPDIWTACKAGDLELVMSILACHPELLEAEYNSRTPLYYASLSGHSNIVNLLLTKGAKDSTNICYQVALNQECRRLLLVSSNAASNE